MTERKLASIRKIKDIQPIKGADRIVKAVVDGWELVTQKSNNFKPGDLVVYFEVDSLLPITNKFSFLEPYKVSAKNSVEGEGYRLKTIRLRGQISQGLILPLSEIGDYNKERGCYEVSKIGAIDRGPGEITINFDCYELYPEEGEDVTELLGVKKYEKPIPANLAGKIRGNFPSFLHKTDQERIQNCFDKFFDDYLREPFEVTLKMDGSSFTAYHKDDKFGVCSRNLDLLETEENAFWQVARKNDLENKMKGLPRNYAIQGELMGPGVQGNREKLDELDIWVFDIYDIDAATYLSSDERIKICAYLGLKHVPLIDINTVFSGFISVKDFLKYADRESLNHPVAEGIVFKSINNPNYSFKVINNNYLLDEE